MYSYVRQVKCETFQIKKIYRVVLAKASLFTVIFSQIMYYGQYYSRICILAIYFCSQIYTGIASVKITVADLY